MLVDVQCVLIYSDQIYCWGLVALLQETQLPGPGQFAAQKSHLSFSINILLIESQNLFKMLDSKIILEDYSRYLEAQPPVIQIIEKLKMLFNKL